VCRGERGGTLVRGDSTTDSFTEAPVAGETTGVDTDVLVSTYQLRSCCSSFRSSAVGVDFWGLMCFS
jgi:hypothetical protein